MGIETVWVNACNMHSGGGRTLIDGFLLGIQESKVIYNVYIDSRYTPPEKLPNNIVFTRICGFLNRRKVTPSIISKSSFNDTVIVLGNLPPYKSIKCRNVILFLGNRFYVDGVDMSGGPLLFRFKIFLEKIYFNFFINNVSTLIVPNKTMKELFQSRHENISVHIAAFDDNIKEINNDENTSREKNSFIYVASSLPYKNHIKLLEAFLIIHELNIPYKLYLTYDGETKLFKSMERYINKYDLNVTFLKNIKRNELLNKYQHVEALIYPSTFESYGLPLVEAKKYNLTVLASDLDYVWDIIDPDFYFNPHDSQSIARSILRYLKLSPPKDKVYNPSEFIRYLSEEIIELD